MADLRVDETSVLTVWELTRSIRSLLESEVGTVWVEGEISNYRRQSSGHQYFTLKDERSQLPCVLFRGSSHLLNGAALADGLHVQACGEVTVYELRGQYQMIVQTVQPKGVGALQARFEALKRKLDAEGLFDAARKKPLPGFPAAVGIVTSPTGAALQDMLNILKRRAPWLRVVINPVRVQGQGAALEIAEAIREFNRWADGSGESPLAKRPAVDLIVVARGGGSIEDLWEFNEEVVARAIASSALPVVSAVGHEIDFTIADFAADLRAPTPSAAAELIAPDTAELLRQLAAARQYLGRRFAERLAVARNSLENFAGGRPGREPRRRVLEERQRLDALENALGQAAADALQRAKLRLDQTICSLRLGDLKSALNSYRQLLAARHDKMETLLCCERQSLSARLHGAADLLRVLGPRATLERGYSITTNVRGEIITAAALVRAGELLTTHLHDGNVVSTVINP